MRISDWSSDVCSSDLAAIAALIRAGLGGLADALPPPAIVAEHPNTLDEARREALGLRRLPETLEAAIAAWQADEAALGWFAPDFAESWLGVRRAELARLAGLAPAEICALYRALYLTARSGHIGRCPCSDRVVASVGFPVGA